MRSALTFALITLVCTCGRAQNYASDLPQDVCSVAFIKNPNGFLIDSLTIRTTLDTVPYGFAFSSDTLVFDISVFRFADELTLETFAAGHAFGRSYCWVDAPSADVYLSVNAGRSVVDSVGLSGVDRLYQSEIKRLKAFEDIQTIKTALVLMGDNYMGLLFAVDFFDAFTNMPNLTRQNIKDYYSNLRLYIGAVTEHPRYRKLFRKSKLLSSNLPGKLDKYELNDKDGQPVAVETPKGQYYVINFYDSGTPASRREHEIIKQSLATDSTFTGVPIISISRESPAKLWQDYVKAGDFSWPHYHENKASKRRITEKMQIHPANTYILINKRNRIEGVYEDVVKLGSALMWRRSVKLIGGKVGG